MALWVKMKLENSEMEFQNIPKGNILNNVYFKILSILNLHRILQ